VLSGLNEQDILQAAAVLRLMSRNPEQLEWIAVPHSGPAQIRALAPHLVEQALQEYTP
jgi:hypothetical protein